MDESLRALERAVLASPGDEAAARAYLIALARAGESSHLDTPSPEALADAPPLRGRAALGPLLPEETKRLKETDPEALLLDRAGIGWVAGDTGRGRAIYAGTLKLRANDLERIGREAVSSFAYWFSVNAALDTGGPPALERLARVVASGDPQSAADRIVALLAARLEPEVGRRLARLARECSSEARPRVYAALATGVVPLDDVAREDLRAAIARELPALQARAYAALRRGARVEDLRRDHASGPPEVRACAFTALAAGYSGTEGEQLVRHALVDRDASVRRAAMQVLSGTSRIQGLARWSRHPRAAEWALGRLVDGDRAVRTEALRVLRRVDLPPRLLPRLQVIVANAPPGIRPVLLRLQERVEKRSERRKR